MSGLALTCARAAAWAGGLMCVALGGLLMVIATMIAFGIGLDEKTAPDREADAVVTDFVRIRSGGGPIGSRSAPRVTYEVEGIRYTSRLRGTPKGRTLRVGDALRIAHRGDEPGRPFPRHYAEMSPPGVADRILPVGLCVFFGAVPLIFAWLLISFARKSEEPRPA
ncbi:hypothetical protein ACH4KN_30510 [Streptomyces sp. NPDC017546]|uniref:hypothetical protein n=1 Tax=unclassified Streptomyces TaxID=2593676 RepID=UPI002362AD83|nr:hypothetical protein [Streptomyces sp. MMBL 11-1]